MQTQHALYQAPLPAQPSLDRDFSREWLGITPSGDEIAMRKHLGGAICDVPLMHRYRYDMCLVFLAGVCLWFHTLQLAPLGVMPPIACSKPSGILRTCLMVV